MTDTCRTCKAWGGQKCDFQGACRRIPPRPNGLEPASWPVTGENDWCLQWVTKKETGSAPRR